MCRKNLILFISALLLFYGKTSVNAEVKIEDTLSEKGYAFAVSEFKAEGRLSSVMLRKTFFSSGRAEYSLTLSMNEKTWWFFPRKPIELRLGRDSYELPYKSGKDDLMLGIYITSGQYEIDNDIAAEILDGDEIPLLAITFENHPPLKWMPDEIVFTEWRRVIATTPDKTGRILDPLKGADDPGLRKNSRRTD